MMAAQAQVPPVIAELGNSMITRTFACTAAEIRLRAPLCGLLTGPCARCSAAAARLPESPRSETQLKNVYGPRTPVQPRVATASISTRCSGTSKAATPNSVAGGTGVVPSLAAARVMPSMRRGILSGVQLTT